MSQQLCADGRGLEESDSGMDLLAELSVCHTPPCSYFVHEDGEAIIQPLSKSGV